MSTLRAGAVVVGGGAVGLAVAARLSREAEVLVLERESAPGLGISSRSSEVIHAGLYYPPGSLKARLCIEGAGRLYAFCRERGVPHRRTGKWLVAVEEGERPALEALLRNARACGADGLEWREGAEVARQEPALRARAALLSPATGILDSRAFLASLQAELESRGGQLVCRCEVLGGEAEPGGFRLRVRSGGEEVALLTPRLVIACGLGAQSLAAGMGLSPPPLWLCKGPYFALSGPSPFSRLVYPLPEAGGGLGIHATLDLQGQTRFGPDARYVDGADFGVDEALRPQFAAAIRRYWQGLDPTRLVPAYAGLRPRLAGPGEPPRDFELHGPQQHGREGLVALYGIESPGLTASLALAECVAEQLRGG